MTLESVAGYHRLPSPPYRALRALEVEASPRHEYLLAAHYIFHRYLALRPGRARLLAPAPRKEVDRLAEHGISGGAETIFFVAEPERTDLESIAPEARMVSRWEWPFAADRFLSGERPNRAELVRIDRPPWFAGRGWLLSLEAGCISELSAIPDRSCRAPIFRGYHPEPARTGRAFRPPTALRSRPDIPGGAPSP